MHFVQSSLATIARASCFARAAPNDSDHDKPRMTFPNFKRSLFHAWKLWGVVFLLLSACAPAPQATPTAASTEVTQTRPPTQTPAPTALPGPSFTNPVYPEDFPDPYVLVVDDTYYAYATTNGSTTNIRVIRSKDLVNWEELGDALPALPEWSILSSGYTWAPGVVQIEDQFLMYYVARDEEADRQCIGIGVSDDPAGPFRDPNKEAFICQTELGGSIDAHPFKDEDGKLYLLWKNDGNCCGLEVALWIQELSPDGMNLVGEPVKLIERDQPWERPLIENPAMVLHNDTYYLFTPATGGNLISMPSVMPSVKRSLARAKNL
jgi:beta-xylosidase